MSLSSGCSPSSMPRVSIIVPAGHGLQMTRDCLESVFATASKSIPCEMVVVEDPSRDDTAAYLLSLGSRVRVHRAAPEKSLAENYNLAACEASGEFLCLLGGDATVTAGWLEKLLVAMEGDPGIGVVGNRHLDPETGHITHAGMVINTQGKPLPIYSKQPADFWPALINQEFQILNGTCWLVRKPLFLELRGFDTDLQNGYEDADFCLRMRQSGYKCFYAAESVIYHALSPAHPRQDQNSWELFRCKWGPCITPDFETFYGVSEGVPEVEEKPMPQKPTDEKKLSHIEERYRYVEGLYNKHPMIASLLRTLIRFATSVAKQLNRG